MRSSATAGQPPARDHAAEGRKDSFRDGLEPYFAAAALMLAVVTWQPGTECSIGGLNGQIIDSTNKDPSAGRCSQQSKTALSFSTADRSS